jgi:hypothetical protein
MYVAFQLFIVSTKSCTSCYSLGQKYRFDFKEDGSQSTLHMFVSNSALISHMKMYVTAEYGGGGSNVIVGTFHKDLKSTTKSVFKNPFLQCLGNVVVGIVTDHNNWNLGYLMKFCSYKCFNVEGVWNVLIS